MDRKTTAWKKSRTFGDVFGGRMSRKIPDRIVRRAHSLHPPGPHDSLPIFLIDNPSRDFFFPLTPEEIRRELLELPKRDWSQITHIWQRRFKKTEYDAGELPLAEFICGSGVRLIVLYPWPNDLYMPLGEKRPTRAQLRAFADYTADLRHSDNCWYLRWTIKATRDFCIERLLYHEIGYHVDFYRRHWSKANHRSTEDFANQYAYECTTKRSLHYRD